MSGSRQDQIYAEFESRLQAIEKALDGVIQSAIQKGILTEAQEKTIVDVNKKFALYPETTIPNQIALSFSLEARNVLAIIKAFLDFLKVAGPTALQLRDRNAEVYDAAAKLVENIHAKINEMKRSEQGLAPHEKDLKILVDIARGFLSFFYDEKSEKYLDENIDGVVNKGLINSPAVQALSVFTKGTVLGKINSKCKDNLPPFIKEIAGILNELAQFKMEDDKDHEDNGEIVIEMVARDEGAEEGQIENMTLSQRLEFISEQYKYLKEAVQENNLNTVNLVQGAEKLRDDLNGLITNTDEVVSRQYNDELTKLNEQKDRLGSDLKKIEDENHEINERLISFANNQHYSEFLTLYNSLDEFIKEFEKIVKSYTDSWSAMVANFDVVLSKELNTKCPLESLAKLLGKELPWQIWDWKAETKNKYAEFLVAEKMSLQEKHAGLMNEFKEATTKLTLKKDIDVIKDKIKAVDENIRNKIGEKEKFNSDIKAIWDQCVELSGAINTSRDRVEQRHQKIKSAKEQLANYVEKRHETYKILDFFEGIFETISNVFGGHYKSQRTERTEYISALCSQMDDLEKHPMNAIKKAELADAMKDGITLFKPRVSPESPGYKETVTLRRSLEEIKKEFVQAALL